MAAKLELTVSQLNEYVRRMFQMDPMLRAIELKGEISNLKFHQSGALFFTMKDENAAISCVMYADEAENLQAMPFEGMRATASGSVALYARGGQYQFVVKRLHAQGVGVLYERLQMLKEKLGREGLFAPERKRALSRYPDTVGVVSSPTGAVIHDILNVSLRRNPNARILLCPVRVQGVGADEEVAAGIRMLERLEHVSVIIVARGGGSMEDLWTFNEESVVRAVAMCKKPVVSAVGHRRDALRLGGRFARTDALRGGGMCDADLGRRGGLGGGDARKPEGKRRGMRRGEAKRADSRADEAERQPPGSSSRAAGGTAGGANADAPARDAGADAETTGRAGRAAGRTGAAQPVCRAEKGIRHRSERGRRGGEGRAFADGRRGFDPLCGRRDSREGMERGGRAWPESRRLKRA